MPTVMDRPVAVVDVPSVRTSAIALHEGGHAVAALRLGLFVEYATIKPQPDSAGHVVIKMQARDIAESTSILLYFAGYAAERLANPSLPLIEAFESDDASWARTSIRSQQWFERGGRPGRIDHACEEKLERVWRTRAEALVGRHWVWVTRVAQCLDALRGLTGAEIEALRP